MKKDTTGIWLVRCVSSPPHTNMPTSKKKENLQHVQTGRLQTLSNRHPHVYFTQLQSIRDATQQFNTMDHSEVACFQTPGEMEDPLEQARTQDKQKPASVACSPHTRSSLTPTTFCDPREASRPTQLDLHAHAHTRAVTNQPFVNTIICAFLDSIPCHGSLGNHARGPRKQIRTSTTTIYEQFKHKKQKILSLFA